MCRKENLIKEGRVAARVLAKQINRRRVQTGRPEASLTKALKTGGGRPCPVWAPAAPGGQRPEAMGQHLPTGGAGPGGSGLLVWSRQPRREESRGLPHPSAWLSG